MTHRSETGKLGKNIAGKYFPNQSYTFTAFDGFFGFSFIRILKGRNPCAFLTPVLERKKAVVNKGNGIFFGVRTKDSKNTALLMQFIIHCLCTMEISDPLPHFNICFLNIAHIPAETVFVEFFPCL